MKRIDVNKLYDDFADLGWDYTAGCPRTRGTLERRCI